jgi:ABC-type spermidine/putrescine transport system permease subunit I
VSLSGATVGAVHASGASRLPLVLLGPIVLVVVVLLGLPLLLILDESFRAYTPGKVGSSLGAELTFANYAELFAPAYGGYFFKTYLLAFISAALSVAIAFPIAYYVVRTAKAPWRGIVIGFLVMMLFLSALVRVYSIELTFGTVGLFKPLLTALSVNMNSRRYLEVLVVLGLLHLTIPISALTLIGTIQNVNPRLVEAAASLGASYTRAHLTVTVPLSLQGILSGFLIAFTIGVSAFVIPWILGKGRVVFISNLIYSRFSEMANYPSGAALSVAMLILSLLVVYLISRFARRAVVQ